jgi:predicted metal-binding protein
MTVRAPNEMSCRELVQLVTDYLENALSIEDRTRLEHHLVFCTWCVDYLQQMRDVLKVTGRLSEDDLSAEEQEQLLRAFRNWKRGGT